jgi:ankyrin repeat protein
MLLPHFTQDGWTPLGIAAQEGHVAVAKLLLSSGAKVDQANTVRLLFALGTWGSWRKRNGFSWHMLLLIST